MKNIKAIGAALMLTLCMTSHAMDFNALEWKGAVDKDNLKIVVAEVEGSPIKAFSATSTYNATLDQLVGAITDMTHFNDWVEGAVESRVIKQLDDSTQACYYVNHVPLPFKNRDGVIVQHVKRVDSKTVIIELSSSNELEPIHDQYARITRLSGAWILHEVAPNKVELTYQVHLDPAGHIPKWIVNLMITETPSKTLMNLHKQDLSRYSDRKLGLLSGI